MPATGTDTHTHTQYCSVYQKAMKICSSLYVPLIPSRTNYNSQQIFLPREEVLVIYIPNSVETKNRDKPITAIGQRPYRVNRGSFVILAVMHRHREQYSLYQIAWFSSNYQAPASGDRVSLLYKRASSTTSSLEEHGLLHELANNPTYKI